MDFLCHFILICFAFTVHRDPFRPGFFMASHKFLARLVVLIISLNAKELLFYYLFIRHHFSLFVLYCVPFLFAKIFRWITAYHLLYEIESIKWTCWEKRAQKKEFNSKNSERVIPISSTQQYVFCCCAVALQQNVQNTQSNQIKINGKRVNCR